MFQKIEILWICVDFEWDNFTGPYEDINDEMEVVFTCILNGICFVDNFGMKDTVLYLLLGFQG